MPRYIVYRHGSNAANQSMAQVMPVGTISLDKRQPKMIVVAEAFLAARPDVKVYNNQFLTFKAYSRAIKDDRIAAEEEDWNAERASQYE